jgi:RNA polymerase sigma factor (sigma-70 family)
MTDIELFENHRNGSDQAFADLVQRHLGWIYGVARRGLGDSHRAEDVAQTVFVLLHRKAPRFAAEAAMIGWLHKATCYATKTVAREERRRKQRETTVAIEQSRRQASAAPDSDADEPDWQQLAPIVDEMVGELSRADREAILLRYYRNLTFVELGAEIGTTEEAARKRVDRAVDKLKRMAAHKGLSCGATLPLYLASQIRITPPSGLLATSTVAATAPPGSALAASSGGMIKGLLTLLSLNPALAGAGTIAASLLLIFATSAAVWWFAPARPTAAAAAPAQWTGLHFVVKDDAGAPIPTATLWTLEDFPTFPVLSPDHPGNAITLHSGNDGSATGWFPQISINVLATKQGFAPLLLRGIQPEATTPYLITLHAGAEISGQVVDDKGQPLAGVRLTAKLPDSPLSYTPELQLTATTDALGRFTMQHATDGKYQISAEMPKGGEAFAVEPISTEVSAGKSPAPVQMKAQGGSVINGKYIGPAGAKLGGREIYIATRLPTHSSRVMKTTDDGSFTIPGISADGVGQFGFMSIKDYSLQIEWPAAPPAFHLNRSYVRFAEVTPATYDGIIVRMVKNAHATGYITDEDGQPVKGVYVEFCPPGEEDGNAIFQTDAAGYYDADVPANESICMELRGEGIAQDQKSDPFTIGPDATTEKDMQARRIITPSHTNEISGVVVDSAGKTVPGASVTLGDYRILPEELLLGSERTAGKAKLTWNGGLFTPATTTTAGDGSFKFNQLRNGNTDVWAFGTSAGWAVCRHLSSQTPGLRLTLAPQDQTITVAGSVVDTDGKPVAGCRMIIRNGDDYYHKMRVESRTDGGGRFSFQATPPWTYSAYLNFQIALVAPDGRIAWTTQPIMSMNDVRVQFKAAATISGRAVNSAGQPVEGASVRLVRSNDRDFGRMDFGKAMDPITPTARSGSDGRFILAGLPVGSTAQLTVEAPDSGKGNVWHVPDLKPEQEIPDIKLPDGITVEGAVRLASTGQPISGATVDLGFAGDEAQRSTISDAQGHYRIAGLDWEQLQMGRTVRLHAFTGAKLPALDGFTNYANPLAPGDDATGVDVSISATYESLHAAWKSKTAPAPPSRYRLAVLDHLDPPITGHPRPQDTLTFYDGQGIPHRLFDEPNQCDSFAIDPRDRSVWVSESDQCLSKFNSNGTLAWSRPGQQTDKLAIDPKTGNAWMLSGGYTIYEGDLLVIDPTSKLLNKWRIHGQDIAYSPADDCFWVAAQTAQKISRDGKVIAESQLRFAFRASSLAVNQKDGSVWICEAGHPEIPASQDRILLLSPDAQLRKSIDCPAREVAIDETRGFAWAVGRCLTKLDLAGNVLLSVPARGSHVAIEPDTGCVWICSDTEIERIDPNGNLIESRPTNSRSPEWLAILAP